MDRWTILYQRSALRKLYRIPCGPIRVVSRVFRIRIYGCARIAAAAKFGYVEGLPTLSEITQLTDFERVQP